MKKENKVVTLTASSVVAINFCQKMVALALGEECEIEQIKLTFNNEERDILGVVAVFTVFEPKNHRPTKYPQFMASFDLVRFAHVRNGPTKWGIASSHEILVCCNSPLGKARTTSHAEFRAQTPMEITLIKPFEWE